VAVYCEDGNEPSGSINGGEFLYHVSNYKLLKDCSTELVRY
jgi:hypothetical protein